MPTHAAELRTVGTASAGRLRCALAVTHPLRFWVVTGDRVSEVAASGDVHLLAVVWDAKTGRVLTGTAPRLTVSRAGEPTYDAAGWPMLSQRLGFHYGDNVALDGAGTYTVDVETAPSNLRFTRGLAGVDGSARFTFEFDYDPALSALAFERPVDAGQRGALPARTVGDVPLARVPPVDALPGEPLETQSLGDAEVTVTLLENELADGSAYVAVSPRTPYRRYPLPFMTLFGTLPGGGFDDVLSPTLDPGLGYHYGARLNSIDGSDRFVVGVGAPPQVARHEGYETAFMTTEPLEFDFE